MKVVYINKQVEDRVKLQLRLAQQEYTQQEPHPYDDARETMPPIACAEHILKAEGMIVHQGGIEFVCGRRSSPLLKMQIANRVLKKLGLKQINRDPAWLV